MVFIILLFSMLYLPGSTALSDTKYCSFSRFSKDIEIGNVKYIYLSSEIVIRNMQNFTYITVLLSSRGVYHYGFAILADPDYSYPILYMVLGTQNQWIRVGDVRVNSTIKIDMLIDTVNKTIYYRAINNVLRIRNLSYVADIVKIRLISSSLDINIPVPKVEVRSLSIIGSNNSDVVSLFRNGSLNKIIEHGKQVFDYLDYCINTASTTPTTKPTTSYFSSTKIMPLPISSFADLVTIFIGLGLIVLVLIAYKKKRSHGP
ncbi:MAG: hypothetical protein J7K21_05165 [Desulfurococcales archaeon]|nr:hypothetical protein [Desulfurococcales archaeon]